MNIALSAVVIFILLLPPIAFYLAFNFGRFPKAGPKLGLLEGLMLSAIFSVMLHGIAILLVKKEIRFDIIALLIGGDLKTFGTVVSNKAFKEQFQLFVLYNAVLIIVGIAAGRVSRFLAQRFGWHSRNELFRLYNSWWYLFNGYKVDGFINTGEPAPFDIVFADVLVNTNAGTMLYSGYLIDFVCEGEKLDRIYLSEAMKREFKKMTVNDKGNYLGDQVGEPFAIEGDTMTIPYNNIINLNLHFISIPSELENIISADSTIEIPELVIEIEQHSSKYIFFITSLEEDASIVSIPFATKQDCLDAVQLLQQSAEDAERYFITESLGKFRLDLVDLPFSRIASSVELYNSREEADAIVVYLKDTLPNATVVDHTQDS